MEEASWWHKKEWWIDRIREYVSEHESESQTLDFKSGVTLRPTNDKPKKVLAFEVVKDVSAMAHGSGGAIIYGVEEDGNSRAKDICAVKSDCVQPNQIEAWLKDNLYPPLESQVTQIPLIEYNPEIEGANYNDQIIVVEVPRSHTAHMVQKSFGTPSETYKTREDHTLVSLRYYTRIGTSNVPMNGSMVEDVMNRTKKPTARCHFAWEEILYSNTISPVYTLKAFIHNQGGIPVKDWKVKLTLEKFMGSDDVKHPIIGNLGFGFTDMRYQHKNRMGNHLSGYTYEISYYSTFVLFPEDEYEITNSACSFRISLDSLLTNPTGIISYTVYADAMKPFSDTIEISKSLENVNQINF